MKLDATLYVYHLACMIFSLINVNAHGSSLSLDNEYVMYLLLLEKEMKKDVLLGPYALTYGRMVVIDYLLFFFKNR